ncbi:MAG: 2Fe-2S iron-sulfur cluster-binding protein [Xanthobacter sp.]
MLDTQVTRRREAAENIIALELRARDGGTLPAFTAGAHIDVHLPNGMVRQYSLLNDPAECDRYEIAILKDPNSRGGSVSAHEEAHEGAPLRIGPPRNLFPLSEDGPALLFAGGIGITPVMCMARQLHREQRPFRMHYCTRNRASTAFHDDLRTAPFAEGVHFHTDDGCETQKLCATSALANPDAQTHIHVCGPPGFITHILETARGQGWREEQLHSELFGAAPVAPGGAFEMHLKRSGLTLQVGPDESPLEAMQAAGVDVPVSCEQGICGTCITRILEGEPDHRDGCLTKAERARNDCFTPCVSRARSGRLVVDL